MEACPVLNVHADRLRMIYPLALSEIKIPASESAQVQSVFLQTRYNQRKYNVL